MMALQIQRIISKFMAVAGWPGCMDSVRGTPTDAPEPRGPMAFATMGEWRYLPATGQPGKNAMQAAAMLAATICRPRWANMATIEHGWSGGKAMDGQRTNEPADAGRPPKRMEQMRQALCSRHYSPRTEQSYLHWVRQFIHHHHLRHPAEMAKPEINAFLTHLAVARKVSASTRNQALLALLFLYRHVLQRPNGNLGKSSGHAGPPVYWWS